VKIALKFLMVYSFEVFLLGEKPIDQKIRQFLYEQDIQSQDVVEYLYHFKSSLA